MKGRSLLVFLLGAIVSLSSSGAHPLPRRRHSPEVLLQAHSTSACEICDGLLKTFLGGLLPFTSNCAQNLDKCLTDEGPGSFLLDLSASAPVFGEFSSDSKIAFFWRADGTVRVKTERTGDGSTVYHIQGLSLDVPSQGLELFKDLQKKGIVTTECIKRETDREACLKQNVKSVFKWLDDNWGKALEPKKGRVGKLSTILEGSYGTRVVRWAVNALLGEEEWGRVLLGMMTQVPRKVSALVFSPKGEMFLRTEDNTDHPSYTEMEELGMVALSKALTDSYFLKSTSGMGTGEKKAREKSQEFEVTNFVNMLGRGSAAAAAYREKIPPSNFKKAKYLFQVCAKGPKKKKDDQRSTDPKCEDDGEGKLYWTTEDVRR
uniref:Uncharacterized protein n=1 Tax=Chromera velia CCMP2878 TaxID=1169474 RepID=A0A0G4HPP4_9ALVE|eukprot:Cvel_7813.t1-p1 / transcript=Cvel_7813.t1 / gene=Cvel_7813 / organism=Chromera_velia_CCMP2878 / gene_product=hypothetical protein / transcript_product=hypothetical protein / location=Cvel_scaffold417:39023-41364(+) / protein_length=374 / sequence_SO=supercontig / SO=protein_coding / is_pseudo=false